MKERSIIQTKFLIHLTFTIDFIYSILMKIFINCKHVTLPNTDILAHPPKRSSPNRSGGKMGPIKEALINIWADN